EPAFLVISRQPRKPSLTVLLAEQGAEERAIRGARLSSLQHQVYDDGFEITVRQQEALEVKDWTPRPQRGTDIVAGWLTEGMPTVTSLFEVKLGIRTGDNPVFMVSAAELDAASASEEERSFFRPVADEIRNAHVVPGRYLFYPYRSGTLLL